MKTTYDDHNWTLFESIQIKYHRLAIAIIKRHSLPDTPDANCTKIFEEEMKIPEDFYRTLQRELITLANKNPNLPLIMRRSMKKKKVFDYKNPSERYYLLIKTAIELKNEIPELCHQKFPLATNSCDLCSKCRCEYCQASCRICGCVLCDPDYNTCPMK